MAAEAFPTTLMESSPAFVDITDPLKLAPLATEKGSCPLPLRLLLKVVKTANSMVRRSDGSLNRRAADLLEYKVPASEAPDRHGVSSKDVVINEQTGVWMRAYLPPVTKDSSAETDNGGMTSGVVPERKRRVIFHFHGGGFAVLSADGIAYDDFCRRLCWRSEAVVISVNYRRAPEHRFPVAYDDCYAALEWLEEYKGDLFKPHVLDLSQCVLMGDSAGANIVHHVGSKWGGRGLSNRSVNLQVDAHVLLFPFFGGQERTPSELRMHKKALLVSVENSDWHWHAFLPPGSDRDHPACNVLAPNAPDLSSLQLPRSLVTIGELDILKDWQLRYAQGLARACKPVQLLYYARGVHCFHILRDRNLGLQLLSDILFFINGTQGE